jgi:uncharacterized protein (TIGR02001 family)
MRAVKQSCSALVIAAACLTAGQAIAQESSPYSANVSLTSDYRFRGISQNNLSPAIQGGFDYERGSFYAGTWGSNVSWLADGGGGAVSNSMELDIYGGWKGNAGSVPLDVGLLYYYYPGEYPTGFNSPNTLELSLGAEFGPVSAKYSYALTDLFGFDDSKGAGYIDLSYGTEFSGFDFGVHVGYQTLPSTTGRSSSDCSYADFSLSVGRTVGGFDLAAAFIGTNAKGGAGECYRNAFNEDLGKGNLVLTVGKSF